MIPLKDDNPTKTFPFVTLALILVNITVFIHQLSLTPWLLHRFNTRFGAVPFVLTRFIDPYPGDGMPALFTVITYMFLHGGYLHLGGNMLFLWVFGNNIEDALGHFRFILFYLLSGIAGLALFLLFDMSAKYPLIGASGAIAGIMGAYLVLYPKARVLTMIPIVVYPVFVRVPAFAFLVFWFLIQVLNAGSARESGVAWTAHIGGFICGLVVIQIMTRNKRPPPTPPTQTRPGPGRMLQ